MAQASTATANGGGYNGDYPLKEIPQPHPHDVLCGRGGGTNNHIGNSHWRMLVAANKQLYTTLPKRQKMLLSRSIVNAVRSQNPPGRFLQKDSKSNQWFDVGDQRAQEKTSQALREGAPDIRKKVAAEIDDDVVSTGNAAKTPGVKATSEKGTPEATNNNNSQNTTKSSVPNEVTSQTSAARTPTHAMPAQQQQQHQPQQTPMMAQQPYMMNGGMPMHAYNMHQMQQQPYPYYPQMQQGMPVQGYPQMAMNEQGMMVPVYPMHPMHPHMMQQHMHPSAHMPPPPPHAMQPPPGNNMPPQTHLDSEPIPYTPSAHSQQPQQHPNGNAAATPNFDEYVSAPPPDGGLEPSGISYGSVMMTDNGPRKLESGGTSFGTAMSYKKTATAEAMPEPTGILENAPGASFGDASMMSVNTRKLEDAGFSFGSAMSFGTNMVDGGLEAIGTSFGSLSLDTRNRETLFHQLELAAAGPEIPPMLNATKSTANLLACSDSEEEDEDESQKHLMARRKSEAWERMQASVANNLSSQRSNHSTVESKDIMPPPPMMASRDKTGTDIAVPTTTFDRDFSQLSAFEDGDFKGDDVDDVLPPPPPAQLEKQDDEDDKLEMYMIQQHTS